MTSEVPLPKAEAEVTSPDSTFSEMSEAEFEEILRSIRSLRRGSLITRILLMGLVATGVDIAVAIDKAPAGANTICAIDKHSTFSGWLTNPPEGTCD